MSEFFAGLSSTLATLLKIGFFLSGLTAIVVLFSQGVLLDKTGEAGWKIIIPFYGRYLFFKRTSDTGGLYVSALLFGVFSGILYFASPALGYYYLLMPLICNFFLCINLADAYKKSTGFGFGLFFLPIIFYPLLAIDKEATSEFCVA